MTTEINTVEELEQAVLTPPAGGSPSKVENVFEEFIIGYLGEIVLRSKLEKLTKKAQKWGVSAPKLVVIKEFTEDIVKVNVFGEEEVVGKKELKLVRIEGEIPHIEGYEFVAKIEHTPKGNIISHVPSNSVKVIPEEFRTADQTCDVCHQNRDRFNTFILRLTKTDTERFPGKKEGDFIMVGSGCLKRFLDPQDITLLINYAKFLDGIKESRDYTGSDHDDFWRGDRYPDQFRYYMPKETILRYCCYAYVMTGNKFISHAEQDLSSNKKATSLRATTMIFDRDHKTIESKNLLNNPSVKKDGDELFDKAIEWLKTKTWDVEMSKMPHMYDFFHNLNVVNQSPDVNIKYSGYVAQLLNSYLREQRRQERIKNVGKKRSFVGTRGKEITISLQYKNRQFFPRSMDHPYDVYKYLFNDRDGNKILWWTSKDLDFKEGKWYEVTAMVKSHETEHNSGQPVTYITTQRGRKTSIRVIS